MTNSTPILQPGELRRLRKAADLTQQQLGELAGVSWQTVSAHENGKTMNLQASNAYRWALASVDK